MFGGFLVDVDLQADIQGRQGFRPLRAQSLGDFSPVHAVDPGKMLGDAPGLVGLNRADEMPLQFQRRQFSPLSQGFLQIVFPEAGLARCRHGGDGRGRLRFADRQQPHRARRALETALGGAIRSRTVWRRSAKSAVMEAGFTG